MSKPDFNDEMDRLQKHFPDWASRNLDRLRQPEAVWVRAPAGVALAAGGVFSVLPGLGLWMLPVGLALLAVDVPVMQDPLARVLRFTNGKIDDMKARKAADKEQARKAYDALKAQHEAKKARQSGDSGS
jgi:hypothetical protein